MSEPLSVAVLGLGEAGAAIAGDLAEAGARVGGFDPREAAGDGLPRADSPEAAVDGAEVVLSVNCGAAAAAAAGCRDWLREEIAGALTAADAALLERLEAGSRRHAGRRVHEVEDASALLRELGVEPRISEASAGWLTQLRDEGKDG